MGVIRYYINRAYCIKRDLPWKNYIQIPFIADVNLLSPATGIRRKNLLVKLLLINEVFCITVGIILYSF